MDQGDQDYPWDLGVLVILVVHSVQVALGLQVIPGSLLVLKVQEYLVSRAHPFLLRSQEIWMHWSRRTWKARLSLTALFSCRARETWLTLHAIITFKTRSTTPARNSQRSRWAWRSHHTHFAFDTWKSRDTCFSRDTR